MRAWNEVPRQESTRQHIVTSSAAIAGQNMRISTIPKLHHRLPKTPYEPFPSFSILMPTSLNKNFWIFPLAVLGYSSTQNTYFGTK